MKNYNEEYFYMRAKGGSYPMLDFGGSQPIEDSHLFNKRKAIDDVRILSLIFAPPVPNNPQLADVHSIEVNMVVSEHLKSHLEQLELKDVQFIPATIQDHCDEVHKGYYIIHIHNLVQCADLEKSEWVPSPVNPARVMRFGKLILDNEAIDAIPLEKRLVIALDESRTYHLYHRSVVDHILKLRPTGVGFYPLTGSTGREPFEDEFLNYILS